MIAMMIFLLATVCVLLNLMINRPVSWLKLKGPHSSWMDYHNIWLHPSQGYFGPSFVQWRDTVTSYPSLQSMVSMIMLAFSPTCYCTCSNVAIQYNTRMKGDIFHPTCFCQKFFVFTLEVMGMTCWHQVSLSFQHQTTHFMTASLTDRT